MGLYKIIQSVPIVGTILYIANSYAFRGDLEAHKRFAGLKMWVKAFLFPLILATFLAFGTLWPMVHHYATTGELCTSSLSAFATNPGGLIVSVMPSLLGFGIGVYALIFALAGPFVKQFHALIQKTKNEGNQSHGSVLVINSDLAFPLVVLIVTTALGIFQQAFSTSIPLLVMGWISFWYAVIATVEIVGVLFGLGDNSLLDKASKERSDET